MPSPGPGQAPGRVRRQQVEGHVLGRQRLGVAVLRHPAGGEDEGEGGDGQEDGQEPSTASSGSAHWCNLTIVDGLGHQ